MVYLVFYTVELRSWRSILIAIATQSLYTHAGVQVGDRVLEANGSKGLVGWTPADTYKDRPSKRIQVDVSPEKAIKLLSEYEGRDYDHLALRLWAASIQNPNKFYFFEIIWAFLADIGTVTGIRPKRITAKTLLKIVG